MTIIFLLIISLVIVWFFHRYGPSRREISNMLEFFADFTVFALINLAYVLGITVIVVVIFYYAGWFQ